MIAIIPAKTNSTRCPNKNWRPFAGTNLVNIAVDCAVRAGLSPLVIGDLDLPVDVKCNAQVMRRPRDLPDDSWAVVAWAMRNLQQTTVLLQPTSPLRTPEFVRHCVEQYKQTGCNVTSWHNGKPSGSVYIREQGAWPARGVCVPDPNPCDIDTEEDFANAEVCSPMLSPKEVAHAANVSDRTIYRAIWRGELPAERVGREWQVSERCLDNLPRKLHTSPGDRVQIK